MKATRAAARLVGESRGKRVSRAAVREYGQTVGEWQDNCTVEFELTQRGPDTRSGKPRWTGVLDYVGNGKPPQSFRSDKRPSGFNSCFLHQEWR